MSSLLIILSKFLPDVCDVRDFHVRLLRMKAPTPMAFFGYLLNELSALFTEDNGLCRARRWLRGTGAILVSCCQCLCIEQAGGLGRLCLLEQEMQRAAK